MAYAYATKGARCAIILVARAVILTLGYLTEPDILTEPGHTYRVITPLMAARIRFGVITPEPFLRHM